MGSKQEQTPNQFRDNFVREYPIGSVLNLHEYDRVEITGGGAYNGSNDFVDVNFWDKGGKGSIRYDVILREFAWKVR